uniref:Uncharacterized protein n=1 Tax=Setaria italica TaxID=4555 RepID=K3ZDL7_SETIT
MAAEKREGVGRQRRPSTVDARSAATHRLISRPYAFSRRRPRDHAPSAASLAIKPCCKQVPSSCICGGEQQHRVRLLRKSISPAMHGISIVISQHVSHSGWTSQVQKGQQGSTAPSPTPASSARNWLHGHRPPRTSLAATAPNGDDGRRSLSGMVIELPELLPGSAAAPVVTAGVWADAAAHAATAGDVGAVLQAEEVGRRQPRCCRRWRRTIDVDRWEQGDGSMEPSSRSNAAAAWRVEARR